MSIFNFFKSKNEALVEQAESNSEMAFKEAFIDENPPVQEAAGNHEKDRINFLIEFDYENEGIKDGFMSPNGTVMELKLERYKGELLNEYDLLIAKKTAVIHRLNVLKATVGNIDPLTDAQLILDITNSEIAKQAFEMERTQIEIGGGAFRIIFTNYKIGFIRGIEKFKQNEILN